MESAAAGGPAGSDGPSGPVTSQDLAAIDDEEVLNKMLDEAVDFEERRILRAALRDLLKRKREKREKERGSRQQDLRQQGLAKTGTTTTGLTSGVGRGTTNRQPPAQKPSSQLSLSSPSSPSSPGSFNRTSGSKANPSVPVALDSPAPAANAAPNMRNVKQMLLDWCRAKTEPYEGVNIRNFSSSWSDGIAFCALVHRFFPDAFEYSTLNPTKRRDNFQLAFSTAERLAGCPPLLDVEDLLRMAEPDWKCVYTYIQEFYRCLVEKGLVKTKKKA